MIKSIGIVDCGSYKSYEKKFNDLSNQGYKYTGSSFFNLIHNFKESEKKK